MSDWNGLPIHTDESLPRDEVRIVVPPSAADLEAACRRLLAAYEQEESEHGFPFNLELRAAHRGLQAALEGGGAHYALDRLARAEAALRDVIGWGESHNAQGLIGLARFGLVSDERGAE